MTMENTDLRFDIIYNNLPVLQEGFEYYALNQLVHNLEMNDYRSFFLSEGPLTAKYIRHSHLFTDYRNCEIDYDGIAKAPVKNDIHFVKAKGEFASFVDGQMRVGRISKKDWGEYVDDIRAEFKDFPVDKNIYHFTPRRSGAAISDYILRELLSEYVKDQAKSICSLTGLNYLRPCEFGYLKIAVPSIEKQDAMIESEHFSTKHLNDVLEIIDSYFDDNGKVESQKILQSIFASLFNNIEFDSHLYYNPLRRVLEWMFRAARKRGLLHDKCFSKTDKINLSDSHLFMAGRPAINSGVICEKAHFPVIIADQVRFILDITGGGSHTTEVPEKDNPNLTAYWAKIDSPFLLYSLTFLICDILIWFGQYVDDNADIDKNKALWRDLVVEGEVIQDRGRFYIGDCILTYKAAQKCREGEYFRAIKPRENDGRNATSLLLADDVVRI